MSIETHRRGKVLEITIDVPKANAINAAVSREMGEVFSDFRDDPDMRVAILTGAGERFFCAGWDLTAAAEGEAYEADYGVGGFGGFPELPGLDKPVIAAVNGLAVGGGFELALAADLVVASRSAEFFFGEVAIGLIPDVGSVLLPRVVPRAIAVELLLTGKRIQAGEAEALGIVNQAVDADVLLPTARAVADQIVSAAPLAVEAVMQALRIPQDLTLAEALAGLRSGRYPAYTRMLGSADALEGSRAFVEGRAPNWTGT